MSIEKQAINDVLAEQRRRGDILHRFDKFAPDADQIAAMDDMRGMFRSVATTILGETKPGREQAAALTALEEAKYWANQSIAKDGVPA
jgi:hypothetical protein